MGTIHPLLKAHHLHVSRKYNLKLTLDCSDEFDYQSKEFFNKTYSFCRIIFDLTFKCHSQGLSFDPMKEQLLLKRQKITFGKEADMEKGKLCSIIV